MTKEQLLALLAAKGAKGVEDLSAEDLATLGADPKELIAIARAAAREEIETTMKANGERWAALQAGQIPDNGKAGGGWNGRDPIIAYEEVPSFTASSHEVPGRKTIIFPRVKTVGSDLEAMFRYIDRSVSMGQKFRIASSKDEDYKAAVTESSPTNAGMTMPPAFEEAMVDAYIAASGWLSQTKQIRGSSKHFWFPVRPRNLDVTVDTIKTLTSITAKIVGEGGTPVEAQNSPWGYRRGEAKTYACWGKITREMVRGNPRSVNDFMTEMSRGVSDILAFDAFRGAGPASNELLGWLNVVDPADKPGLVDRTTTMRLKRDDLVNMLSKVHQYFEPTLAWMSKNQTLLNLALEKDSQLRPLFLEWGQSVGSPVLAGGLLGYPVIKNWQSPNLGSTGDLVLFSPAALWTFFQDAVSIQSSDQVEWLAGNVHIKAEVGVNVGVILKEGLWALKTL